VENVSGTNIMRAADRNAVRPVICVLQTCSIQKIKLVRR